MNIFKNKLLRKIFGSKKDEVTGEWSKLHNEEFHDFVTTLGESDKKGG
jgi:hypothetical protein